MDYDSWPVSVFIEWFAGCVVILHYQCNPGLDKKLEMGSSKNQLSNFRQKTHTLKDILDKENEQGGCEDFHGSIQLYESLNCTWSISIFRIVIANFQNLMNFKAHSVLVMVNTQLFWNSTVKGFTVLLSFHYFKRWSCYWEKLSFKKIEGPIPMTMSWS